MVEVEVVIMVASMRIATDARRRPGDRSSRPVPHPKGARQLIPSAGATWACAQRSVRVPPVWAESLMTDAVTDRAQILVHANISGRQAKRFREEMRRQECCE